MIQIITRLIPSATVCSVWLAAEFCLALAGLGSVAAQSCNSVPAIPAMFTEKEEFESALTKSAPAFRLKASALTVPHHLLAARLIAAGFSAIDTADIDKIVLLSPDHFKRARRPFATTKQSFDTLLGPVCAASDDAVRLLANHELVEDSDLFAREHGFGAVLPFIRHFLPGVTVLPVAVSITSRQADWDAMVALLRSIVTDRTMIVQSTDFSHYLTAGNAALRDQVTLNLLAAGDAEAVGRLGQPQHLDSRGAQYIVMRLAERYGPPIVLYNENSQSFSDAFEPETTSYVVQVYPRERVTHILPALPGSRVICFAGDMFVGRFFAQVAARSSIEDKIVHGIDAVLGGCPLIVNLEGVFGHPKKAAKSDLKLVMRRSHALRWLKRLGVFAASLANNHAHDLGKKGYARTAQALQRAGIIPLHEGRIVDLGKLRVVALSDIDNQRKPHAARISSSDLERIMRSRSRPPLAAFVHWGEEWRPNPGPREDRLATDLTRAGTGLVVGAHPHVRRDRLTAINGGDALLAYSLGNLLFDQRQCATGSVLELRIFAQGTTFGRLVPIPNFYADALVNRSPSGQSPRCAP